MKMVNSRRRMYSIPELWHGVDFGLAEMERSAFPTRTTSYVNHGVVLVGRQVTWVQRTILRSQSPNAEKHIR